MRTRSLAAGGLVLIAMSAAACSGGSGSSGLAAGGSGAGGSAAAASPAAAAPLNVCALMTAQHASSIVGVTYSKATESTNMCSYTTTDAPIGMYILIFPHSAGTAAWKAQLATMEEDGGGPPVALSGFSGPAAEDGTEISVQAGADIIDVHGGDPNGGSGFPRSSAIAKAIASQLP